MEISGWPVNVKRDALARSNSERKHVHVQPINNIAALIKGLEYFSKGNGFADLVVGIGSHRSRDSKIERVFVTIIVGKVDLTTLDSKRRAVQANREAVRCPRGQA